MLLIFSSLILLDRLLGHGVDCAKLPGESELCLTPGCLQRSADMFKNMNLSSDPCENFFDFACGKFHKEFIVPEDEAEVGVFERIEGDVYPRGKVVLEEPVEPHDWDSVVKAKMHYKACMNETIVEEVGVEPLKDLLQQLGGWPILEGSQWNESQFTSWHDQVADMMNAGIMATKFILSVHVAVDEQNSTRRILYFDQPELGIEREFFVDENHNELVHKHYFDYMKQTAILLGANQAREDLDQELKQMLEFEARLADISAPKESRRNKTKLYNPFKFEKIQDIPGFPPLWSDFLNQLTDDAQFSESDTVIIKDVNYFWSVSKVLDETDARTISNYLGWRAVKSLMKYLNEEAREIRQKFRKHSSGEAKSRPRWKFCTKETGIDNYEDKSFRLATASMFIQRYFSPKAKEKANDLVKYVKKAFLDELNEVTWMDEKTKEKAKNKLGKMLEFIAYPDEILNRTLVDEFYERVNVSDDDFLGNILSLTKWSSDYNFALIDEPFERDSWLEHAKTSMLVNAFYRRNANAIYIPVGFLQNDLFNEDFPFHSNFGGIGIVMGHELTHGFDDRGGQFDENGNLLNWWDSETRKTFEEKTKCMIEQYNGYRSEQVGMSLNGVYTLPENIADNGGMKMAFLAYQKWLEDHGLEEEAKLPGLDFNSRQLYWLSIGQGWCTKTTDEALVRKILTGSHSPAQFRLNGPLSNNPYFAEAFNCPLGSPMNPEKKCPIW